MGVWELKSNPQNVNLRTFGHDICAFGRIYKFSDTLDYILLLVRASVLRKVLCHLGALLFEVGVNLQFLMVRTYVFSQKPTHSEHQHKIARAIRCRHRQPHIFSFLFISAVNKNIPPFQSKRTYIAYIRSQSYWRARA